jgi:adenosylcobinamide-phosphate synthase
VSAAAVLVAAALDAAVREPPAAVHPVRIMGRYLDTVQRWVPAAPAMRAVACGGLAWVVGAGGSALAGALPKLSGRTSRWPGTPLPAARTSRGWRTWLVEGVALWPLFSHRMLLDEVSAVESALADGVDAGRAAVARIVSRDVAGLSEAQVRAAAIESLAENLSDSVVAPLLWFAVGGLPAAALYRFANTADACWGYRTPRCRYAGRVAARADDLLNLVPSKLTALLLGGAMATAAGLPREARRTLSPNAGWPMAAAALRLGIRLDKPGVYTLNPDGRLPDPADTEAALRLARRRGWLAIGLAGVAAGARCNLARRR